MAPDYHHIAYLGVDIANPVTIEAVLAMADRSGLPAGAKVLDIGAGTGGVSAALARRFRYQVHAIERDPVMVSHIADRVERDGLADRVTLVRGVAPQALDVLAPADMMVALGSSRIGGSDVTTAAGMFQVLADLLASPGYILWGDLTWIATPPEPLRQIVSLSSIYESDDGWKAAAEAAGMTCVSAELSPQAVWDDFFGTADRRVRDWLEANPGVEGRESLQARADQIRATFDFGRPYLGFGLYLFRKP
ncbi:MAG: methyltransferase domain-containing protein [Brevundimonas sp.]|jgi:precorrin-6B methylase 2|nr:methyltransferase domain-containing protein [Brevundimonas sp.]MCA3717127.1 methyltransferase domain-containing protein [Brevundimonas sp.]